MQSKKNLNLKKNYALTKILNLNSFFFIKTNKNFILLFIIYSINFLTFISLTDHLKNKKKNSLFFF